MAGQCTLNSTYLIVSRTTDALMLLQCPKLFKGKLHKGRGVGLADSLKNEIVYAIPKFNTKFFSRVPNGTTKLCPLSWDQASNNAPRRHHSEARDEGLRA